MEEIIIAKIKFTTDVKWSGNSVLSTANSAGNTYIIDEPESLGGTNKGPNPVEYILGALGGCINVLVISFAKKFEVEVLDLKVHLEGDLDPDGFLGINPDVRPGFQEIRYSIEIDSPSPKENIQALLQHVDKVCPVKDTLQGTPTYNKTKKLI